MTGVDHQPLKVSVVSQGLVLGEDLPLLHLGDQGIDKRETLTVGFLHNFLVSQINVALDIRSSLDFTALCNSGIHYGLQPFRGGGDGFHHGTAQFGGERRYINDGLLFCIDIALVQGDHHGDAQFQQLSREEQTAAQVGGIHNVDDGIGVFVLYIGTGDALLRCERGHGVGAGQIHGDQIFRPTAVGFLNVVLLFFNRHAAQLPTFSFRPVRALYMVVLPEFGLPVKAIRMTFLPSLCVRCTLFTTQRLPYANRRAE